MKSQAPASPVPPEPCTDAKESARVLRELLSPDGYTRERALRRLPADLIQGPVLQAVLLRLNDWVPQVRNAAQLALQKVAPRLGIDSLLHVLPALQALERGRRADHSASLALIRRSLAQQVQGMDAAQRQQWHRLAQRGAPAVAFFAFDVLLNWADGNAHALPAVLATGLQARQPQIQHRTVQWVSQLPAAQRAPLYVQALRSPNARTRLAALRALGQGRDSAAAKTLPVQDLPDWLRTALLDAHISVRYLALMLCGGPRDALLAHARAALQAPSATARARCAALGLLADLGLPAASPLALAALQDPVPTVRRAAYAAALRLQAAPADALALRALQDPANKVFALVLQHIKRNGQAPGADALRPHMQGDSTTHWLRLLQLAELGNPWDWLIALLSVPRAALADAQSPHAQALAQVGPRWQACLWVSFFIQANPVQSQRIRQLLPQAPVQALFGPAAPHFTEAMRAAGLMGVDASPRH